MPLTPEQFNKLVTKDYLDEKLENIVSRDDFKEMKNEIITSIDGLTKLVKDMKDEGAMNISAHDRYEKRITRVEKHLELSPV
jgi:hypothetical protein